MREAVNSASVVALHVGASTETVGEKENIGVAPRRQRSRANVVDAGENAGAVR